MAAKGWGKSKVTRESLLPYVASGVIPEFKQERWRVPPANEVEPLPRPGEFVIFLSFLDRGFALPTSDFLRPLLAFNNIKVSDLGPHSVQQISLFVALCECYLGCPPYFPLWVSIFHGRATGLARAPGAHPERRNHLPGEIGESFIDMALPKKAQSQWRRFWFYAWSTPPGWVRIPQYTSEPSVPRRLNVRSLPHDQEEVVEEEGLVEADPDRRGGGYEGRRGEEGGRAEEAAEAKKMAADPASMTSSRGEPAAASKAMGATASSATSPGAVPRRVRAAAKWKTGVDSTARAGFGQAQERALAEARKGFVKESFYREAEFRATHAEEVKKKAKAEVADLTKDTARGATAALREEIASLKQQHAKELATEKATLEGVVLAVQAEKTSFEAFVREMSRQLLVRLGATASVASPPQGPVPERGESVSWDQSPSVASPSRGASPRAWRVRLVGPVPERGESVSWDQSPSVASPLRGASPQACESVSWGQSPSMRVRQCELVETATPRECLEAATTRIIACAGDILAALQYLSPREVIPRDAPSVFKAVSDIPAVVDWLRRSSCRVGVTMALSMVLAHYSEGFEVEEVTAGFPSETGEFDVAEVLRLMEAVRPYADRVLATADLETHIVSQSPPEDAGKEAGPKDFPAERMLPCYGHQRLVHLSRRPYTPKFRHGEDGAEPVIEENPGPPSS
ncbi:hypothetical protein QYE76_034827 [Lolium multiflorum]|uniref:Transposase (putative) gypsy type domain-containing protein n=1 Tax=Lolium multiflorum TaxID=4521 RepID=A0AAD8R0E3_LOLMU|nr:hypothetical protein QYE76_034827 [Lolium multiflorum]